MRAWTEAEQENAFAISRALAHRAAATSFGPWEARDLEAIALLAAWEALASYDPARGTKLSTHVWNRVRCELANERERLQWYGRAGCEAADRYRERTGAEAPWLQPLLSVDVLVPWEEEESGTWSECLVDREADVERQVVTADCARRVRDAVEALAEPMRTVIRERYWHERRHVEIATRMGVTVRTVRYWLNKAHRQLRRELEETPCASR